jgi:hypothetical protein
MTTDWAEVAEQLRAARDVIRRPEAWTKGASARDSNGAVVVAHSPNAVAWCTTGACRRRVRTVSLERAALLAALSPKWDCSVSLFNDDPATTHRMVMLLFGRAIKWAEKQATP